MNEEKPVVITSVTEALELVKRAGFTFAPFIHRSKVYPVSPEQWAKFQEKVRAFAAVDLTELPECLRPHIEEMLPPKWGEPMYSLTVNKLGHG